MKPFAEFWIDDDGQPHVDEFDTEAEYMASPIRKPLAVRTAWPMTPNRWRILHSSTLPPTIRLALVAAGVREGL